jgi:hypothetical protein
MMTSVLKIGRGQQDRGRVVAGKNGSNAGQSWSTSFFGFGPGQTEAATVLHKELLETYEKMSHAWLARVQSEVAMWSELATTLTATRSVPEALETGATR